MPVWLPGTSLSRSIMEHHIQVVVIISAASEWRAVCALYPGSDLQPSPYGDWFTVCDADQPPLVFMHGGWGKIAAAGSTQYAIDHWQPDLLVNLGTCGGFRGHVEQGTIVLVERTIVYDIYELMGDSAAAVDSYATDLDLSWLKEEGAPAVLRTLMVSADQDLVVDRLPELQQRYGAVVGDWESGAIAWVASRNQVPCLILRGVTDLVGEDGGDAYGKADVFHLAAVQMMQRLVADLPAWLAASAQVLEP